MTSNKKEPVKDVSIREFLDKLGTCLDAEDFKIVDYWDADPFAIGIARRDSPSRLVYVCTFERPRSNYYYECEINDAEPIDDSNALSPEEGVSFAQVLEVIRQHLDLKGV